MSEQILVSLNTLPTGCLPCYSADLHTSLIAQWLLPRRRLLYYLPQLLLCTFAQRFSTCDSFRSTLSVKNIPRPSSEQTEIQFHISLHFIQSQMQAPGSIQMTLGPFVDHLAHVENRCFNWCTDLRLYSIRVWLSGSLLYIEQLNRNVVCGPCLSHVSVMHWACTVTQYFGHLVGTGCETVVSHLVACADV